MYVDVSKTFEMAEAIFTAFCDYVVAAFEAVTDKLPKVLEEISKLAD